MDTKTQTKVVNREGFYGVLREDYKAHTGFGIIDGQRKDFYHTFPKGTEIRLTRTEVNTKNLDKTVRVRYFNGYDFSGAPVPLHAFDMFRLEIVETTTSQLTVTKL